MSVALICGVSEGLGTALCRAFSDRGLRVAGLSRHADVLAEEGIPMEPFTVDITDPQAVGRVVDEIEASLGGIDVVVHNAAAFSLSPFLEASLEDFERAWQVGTRAAFVLAQRVLPPMVARGRGTLLFTGATASLRGRSRFSALASSKFATRGLAQSLAREFGPQGIHVVHIVVDGVIWCRWTRERFGVEREHCLDPAELAALYVHLHDQPRSTWVHEFDVRPQGETF